MKTDPTWIEISEAIRTLDAHRVPELTVERLLEPPTVPISHPEPRRFGPVSAIRLASVAAVLIAGVLLWRVGSEDPAPVLDAPPVGPTTPTVTPPAVPRPVAAWSFAETGVRYTSSVDGVELTAGAGVASAAGQNGAALSLPGVWPSAAQTRDPLVDTATSFTVSTIIKADELRDCLFQAFASQDGETVSGFELGTTAGCAPDEARFTFVMSDGDADVATHYRLVSRDTIAPGRWYHVVAVHDAEADEMLLYVDGVLEAVGPAPTTPWTATGPFAVGRARFSSQERDYFAGLIDTTTVYDVALTSAEVAQL